MLAMSEGKEGPIFRPSDRGQSLFGLNPVGQLIHIDYADRGLGELICPDCGSRLIAKKGAERQHHFSHASGSACDHVGETALHRIAKEVLTEHPWFKRPKLVVEDETCRVEEIVKLVDVEMETWEQSFRPDLRARVAIPDEREVIFIEIKVSHAVDREKLAKVQALGNSMIEVDLSKIKGDIYRPNLIDLLRERAPRHWVHHREQERFRSEIRARKVATGEDIVDDILKNGWGARGNSSLAMTVPSTSYATPIKRDGPRPKSTHDGAIHSLLCLTQDEATDWPEILDLMARVRAGSPAWTYCGSFLRDLTAILKGVADIAVRRQLRDMILSELEATALIENMAPERRLLMVNGLSALRSSLPQLAIADRATRRPGVPVVDNFLLRALTAPSPQLRMSLFDSMFSGSPSQASQIQSQIMRQGHALDWLAPKTDEG